MTDEHRTGPSAASAAAAERAAGGGEPAEARRLRRVLDAMLDDIAIGVSVRDAHGAVVDFELTFVNDRSVDGAGRRREQMMGQRVLTLYPQWRASGLFDRFRAVVETGVPYVVEALHYADEIDGVAIEGYWRLSVVPFGDGYLACSRDVTAEIQAARLEEEARARATAERDAVQLLQDMALPRRLPRTPGLTLAAHYRPAESVVPIGGDWYDAFELPEGRVGLVVGDVAGHGRSAAASMVRQRTALATLARFEPSPAAVLDRAHAAAIDAGDTFTTCCYVVVDPARGTLTVARAGHLPPLLVPHGGEPHPLWVPGGLPLGIEGATAYHDHVVALDGPATLVLYTDGLVERRGVDLLASIDVLAARLGGAAERDSGAVCDALVAAVAGERIDDDFCVLVAGITPHGRP